MTKPSEGTDTAQPVDPNVEFVIDLVGDMNGLSTEERLGQERDVVEFVRSIEATETRLVATDVLMGALRHRSPHMQELIEERDKELFGERVAEVLPEHVGRVTERLLRGKNVAAVIRAGSFDDLESDVLSPLRRAGKLAQLGGPIEFPNRTMTSNSARSSALHIDIEPDLADRFPYTLSASQTEEGSVLFIAGLASKRARGWTTTQYDLRKSRLGELQAVRRLYDEAASGMPPQRREVEIRKPGLEIDLSVVRLEKGDVVIWPQGGEGADVADWHAFRQIGDEPRVSVTRHFVPMPEAVVDLRDSAK